MPDKGLYSDLAQVVAVEKTRQQMGWTPDQFYAFSRLKRLPIYNVDSAKQSVEDFEQTLGMSPFEREEVKGRLLSVAGKLKIDTSPLVKPVKSIQLSDRSLIMKHAVLMSQGNWNKCYYSKEEIEKGLKNTDWSVRENGNLFLEHSDGGVGDWIGNVGNFSMKGDTLYGDLHIHNPIWAASIRNGKPHFGISPKVIGTVYKEEGNAVRDLLFKNFSLVLNPAVKTAYLNNSESLEMEDEEKGVSEKRLQEIVKEELEEIENAKVTDMEATRKRMGKTSAQFYAVPKTPPSASKLPIFDASHVRNALARFNQVQGLSPVEKATALRKIKAAAKRFGIKANLKEEEVKTMDELEGMDDLFELYELKKLSTSAILRKAKELKTEGEPFREAVKRAAKLQEEEAGTPKEPVPEAEPEKPEEKKEEKPEEPAPAKEETPEAPEAPAAEAEEKMKEMEKEIKTLKEQINEPAVKTLKKVEPNVVGDIDRGMMLYLQEEYKKGGVEL